MKKSNFLTAANLTLLAGVAMLTACGGDSSSGSDDNQPAIVEVENLKGLGECSLTNNGVIVYVQDEHSDYQCLDGLWQKLDTPDTEDDPISSGTEPSSSSSSVVDATSSSSVVDETSSSSEGTGNETSSSSVETVSSSSVEKTESSSSVTLTKTDSALLKLTESLKYKSKYNNNLTYGTLKDSRDGNSYKTITIGNQNWMAENLNYAITGSDCYKYDSTKCAASGRYYTWTDAATACPEGWNVPSDEEWAQLIDFVKKTNGSDVGNSLNSSVGWNGKAVSQNDFGFSALPFGGVAYNTRNYWTGIGSEAHFLSSTGESAYRIDSTGFSQWTPGKKMLKFSIRCVQKTPVWRLEKNSWFNKKITYGELKDSRDGKSYKTVQIKNQIWMAQNLNYKSAGGVCYYGHEDNCQIGGRLYTWGEAKSACPTGWRLPTTEEWRVNMDDFTEDNPIKARSAVGWTGKLRGTNEYGFSAIPTGYLFNPLDSNVKEYRGADSITYFWGADQNLGKSPQARVVSFNSNYSYAFYSYYDTTYALSVRCIKDIYQPDLTDSRDGQIYKTVQIGEQIWMAQNLNYETDSSFCYDNETTYCQVYGRLYTWAAAMGKTEEECGTGNKCNVTKFPHQGVCPSGWHLPSEDEWDTLFSQVMKDYDVTSKEAGFYLKSTTDWYDSDFNSASGNNAYGFNALPAGNINSSNFYYLNNITGFWSSTEYDNDQHNRAYRAMIQYSDGQNGANDPKELGFSVRCLKD